jgi:hypothetical protein
MEPKKKLSDMTMEEKMAALQAGAGGPAPMSPNAVAPMDTRVTQQDMDQAKLAQQMLLQNSPTRGMMPPPNAQQMQMQDTDMQNQMDELGEGVEVVPQQKRFQRLLGR